MSILRWPAGGLLVLIAVLWATAEMRGVRADPPNPSAAGDTREISEEFRKPADPGALLVGSAAAAGVQSLGAVLPVEAAVGDQSDWVALHDTGGFYYLKTFELRAADDTAEIWVAVGEGLDQVGDPDGVLGLDFPAGDCRNDGVRNVVTDAQANYLLSEFTNNIKDIDEAWFGEPAFRDGTLGLLPQPSETGRQVVLIDNVRDDQFYDTNNSQSLPYIAGFFTTAMDFFHNRNVMSIDGFDWLHRTGADPAHDPSTDPCLNAPARPFLYEGVFAHEYQHLIHNDYDPDELNWVNEGMSDLAIELTGYGNPSLHVDEKGNDSHVMAFQGWSSVAHPDWNPIPRPAGPENSLTVWEDQGPNEILADYGAAFMFMLYLYDHGYGQDFFLAWHHNTLNGIAGLDDSLAAAGSSDTFEALFADYSVMVLVDAVVDGGAIVQGADEEAITSESLDSTIYFTGNAYDTPGAPPWGSDYIPLGRGNKLKGMRFDGADQFVFPGGNDWTIDGDGYWTSPDEEGGTVYPNDLDSSIARTVSVPDGAATLTFEHWYQAELGWDFAFVQVLDGDGFVSLPCTGTTTDHNPAAIATIADEVPGYTGPTEDPGDPATAGTPAVPLVASCDISSYAGMDIILSFRMMSDPSVQFDGWHIRNVAINGAPVDVTPADLSDWDNQQFFQPAELEFKLTLVGVDGRVGEFGHVDHGHYVTVVRADLDAGSTYMPTKQDRKALKPFLRVYAIVTAVPSDESSALYFPYSLTVHGEERADGANIPKKASGNP